MNCYQIWLHTCLMVMSSLLQLLTWHCHYADLELEPKHLQNNFFKENFCNFFDLFLKRKYKESIVNLIVHIRYGGSRFRKTHFMFELMRVEAERAIIFFVTFDQPWRVKISADASEGKSKRKKNWNFFNVFCCLDSGFSEVESEIETDA